jgi:hypothetical protein
MTLLWHALITYLADAVWHPLFRKLINPAPRGFNPDRHS